MKLAIIGGGGFRVPLVYRALLDDHHSRRVTEVALHDVDPGRLTVIESVLGQMARTSEAAPVVHAADDLGAALDGADFVFSAVRVGGLGARVADERAALELGILGQETIGPGGIAFGLRTVPVALAVAEQVQRRCPDAWVINFTNPAGMITEAMLSVLGGKVVGICDSPLGLVTRARRALGLPATMATGAGIDYVGLNHLGWLNGLLVDGVDRLPDLLADPDALAGTEEGQLFGVEWMQTLEAIPNEYLYYFYNAHEALAATASATETRGEFLMRQQTEFYAAARAEPAVALATWNQARRERNATYMSELRNDTRDETDIEDGGYERVALALMAAISRDEPADLILNVRNGDTLPGLPADAVIEVPCHVDGAGPRAHPVSPLTGHRIGLVQQIKEVERLTIAASRAGSTRLAAAAFALHPLVDSVGLGRLLLDRYRRRIPDLDRVFRSR